MYRRPRPEIDDVCVRQRRRGRFIILQAFIIIGLHRGPCHVDPDVLIGLPLEEILLLPLLPERHLRDPLEDVQGTLPKGPEVHRAGALESHRPRCPYQAPLLFVLPRAPALWAT